MPYSESSGTDSSSEVPESDNEYQQTAVKKKRYSLPDDPVEQDRLDLQHSIYTQLYHGKLSLAPLEDQPLDHVLDLGTGTGIWAEQFAIEHPESHVLATDICPAVDEADKPANLTFQTSDAELHPWTFPHPFNYIHGRALLTCFRSPASIIQQSHLCLLPAGLLELQDAILPFQFSTPPPRGRDSAFAKWNQLIVDASVVAGRPWTNVQFYAKWMRETGFEDVREQRFFCPVGVWGADEDGDGKTGTGVGMSFSERDERVGRWMVLNVLNAMERWTGRILKKVGWTEERSRQLVEAVREELMAGEIRAYCWVVCVVGRKAGSRS